MENDPTREEEVYGPPRSSRREKEGDVESFADRLIKTGGVLRAKLSDGPSGSLASYALHASNRTRSSLVDPASSHMLVSKIKPCMSQCMPN